MIVLPRRTFAAVVVALLGLAACGEGDRTAPPTAASATAPTAATETVKLGFAAPLTGPQSHYGIDMRNGIALALEEINASKPVIGGKAVQFELLAEDDQADPKLATVVAQKLVDAGIRGMLGHFNSGTSIPASKVYADAGVPQIAMASAPQYTRSGWRTTFRAFTSDVQQGAVMGRWVVETLGAKQIAVIDDRTAYGQALADEFERAAKAAGATLGKREFTSDRATDFAALLTSIRAGKPDAIFFAGTDAQGAPMAKQMRGLGLKATLTGGEMLKSPNYLTLAGPAAEGTVASLAGMPIDRMPGGLAYAAKYKAKFGTEVEIYSPYAYDATQVMVAAMKAADSTQPSVYLTKLASIRHAGVTSSAIEYDEFGDLKAGAITIWAVEKGAWVVREVMGQ